MSKYEQPSRRPAVVTGASSGIGAATALVLGAQGFPVALGARRTEKCEEVAAQIREAGGEAVVHPLDLTDDQSVADFAQGRHRRPRRRRGGRLQRRLRRPGRRSTRSTPSGCAPSST